jgi:hypothetical protein
MKLLSILKMISKTVKIYPNVKLGKNVVVEDFGIKGGFLYVGYLIAGLFGMLDKLPAIVLQKHPVFQLKTVVKVFTIYVFLLFVYGILRKTRFLCERVNVTT